jgi:hypothetical protein
MKKIYLGLTFSLLSLTFYSQQIDLDWATTFGSPYDNCNSIITDQVGNVYSIGRYSFSGDFDPSIDTFNLTSNGSNDIFISKLDINGNFVWVKSIGGTGMDYGYSIALDELGNVYTTGFFHSITDFDPGAGTYYLRSFGNVPSAFIQKLDSNGNFVWAKSMGGILGTEGRSITLDIQGNVYTIGEYQGTTDFDPGTATFNLTSSNGSNLFIQKLNPNGSFIWAKSIAAKSSEMDHSITIDNSGNILATGSYNGDIDFDPDVSSDFNLNSGSSENAFVLKLDNNGDFIWVKSIDGQYIIRGHSITSDLSGNVYTVGYYSGSIDVDPSTSLYSLPYRTVAAAFIQKLDANGNFVWADSMIGSAHSVTTDSTGNVYMAASHSVSSGPRDIVLKKYDAVGNNILNQTFGGPNEDQSDAITIDMDGNILLAGNFESSVDFDPGSATFNLISVPFSYPNIFIIKLNQLTVSIEENTMLINTSLYPNPTTNQITIVNDQITIKRINIIDSTGKKLKTISVKNNSINITSLPSGIYFIQLITEEGTIIKKFVKQ